jgi:hypothetical protein
METYQKLQAKMQAQVWTDVLAEDDVKLLQDVEVMSGNLISQVYIFIDLFHQYIDLVQSAAIFSPDFVEPSENDANVYPTQTSSHLESVHDPAMSGNRAERRAEEKKYKKNPPQGQKPRRKTPFEVAGQNLGEPKQNDM